MRKYSPDNKVVLDVDKLSELSSPEFRLYAIYTGICNANNNKTNISNSALMEKTGLTIRSIQTNRRSLIDKGYMTESSFKNQATEISYGKMEYNTKIYHSITEKGAYINPKGESSVPNIRRTIEESDVTKRFKELVVLNDCPHDKKTKVDAFRMYEQLPLDTQERMFKALKSHLHKIGDAKQYRNSLLNFIDKGMYTDSVKDQIIGDKIQLCNLKAELKREEVRLEWLMSNDSPNEKIDRQIHDVNVLRFKYNKLNNKLKNK
jgi:hypothetical protein